jgi:hypothetical protein
MEHLQLGHHRSPMSLLERAAEPGLPDPTTLNGWADGNIELISEDLLWQRGSMPTVSSSQPHADHLPGALLGATFWRWGGSCTTCGAHRWRWRWLPSPQPSRPYSAGDHRYGHRRLYVAAVCYGASFRPTARCAGCSSAERSLAGTGLQVLMLVLIPTLGLMTLWFAWRRGLLTLRQMIRCRRFNRLATGRWGG